MNKAICGEADARRSSYTERLTAGDEALASKLGYTGHLGVKDLRFHEIQPSFRALLIVVDLRYYRTESSKTVGRLPLFLVRTGIEDGLSAPITFESIADKVGGYLHNGEPHMAVVKTTRRPSTLP